MCSMYSYTYTLRQYCKLSLFFDQRCPVLLFTFWSDLFRKYFKGAEMSQNLNVSRLA